MIVLMGATWAIAAALFLIPGWLYQQPSVSGSGQTSDDTETIYSGTVETLTAEKLTVAREIMGKPPEYMSFVLSPETKIEGKLQEGVRVTVKFRPSDDGPIAETIIVREPPPKAKKKS